MFNTELKKGTFQKLIRNSVDGNKAYKKPLEKAAKKGINKVLRKTEKGNLNFGFPTQVSIDEHWNPNQISRRPIAIRKNKK